MTKFFSKNELVLIALVLVLFNINGFCKSSINGILYGGKLKIFAIVISGLVVIYSMHKYHRIVTHIPIPEVGFSSNNIHETITCDRNVNRQIGQHKDQICQLDNIKKICKDLKKDKLTQIDVSHELIEKIVFNLIALLMIIVVISTIMMQEDGNINERSTRIIIASPLVIIAAILFYYINTIKPRQIKSESLTIKKIENQR